MYNLGIVIPTYNEKDNIVKMLDLLNSNLNNKGHKIIILIMDDSSPDGTSKIVQEYISNHKIEDITTELKVRAGKEGLATAYTQGFQYLIDNYNPEFLLSIDADLSHNPKYIIPMLEKITKENLDLVIGSRYVTGGGVENWGFVRKMLSKGGSIYAKTILGVAINDLTGGFNLYRSSIFKSIILDHIKARGYLFQIEMKYRTTKAGYKVSEYPIIFTDRINGKSKMSKKIILEALLGVWGLRK